MLEFHSPISTSRAYQELGEHERLSLQIRGRHSGRGQKLAHRQRVTSRMISKDPQGGIFYYNDC